MSCTGLTVLVLSQFGRRRLLPSKESCKSEETAAQPRWCGKSAYATSWSEASMEKYILIAPLGDLENFIDQCYLCFSILQTKPTREFSRSPSLSGKIKIDRQEVAWPGFPAPSGGSSPQRDSGAARVPGVQPESDREGDDRTEGILQEK